MLFERGIRPEPGALLLSLLLLAGCATSSGGGANNDPPAQGGGGPQPPAAVNYDTAEYRRNFGLALIDAIAAYDRGATGDGVTVAVINTGIDIDHPELTGQIHAASTNIRDNNAAALNDADGHGTEVAGVIVAKRNNVGVHGVAFNSKVLALRAEEPGTCDDEPDGCSFFDSVIARGVTYAVNNGARIIDLSLGGDDAPSATLRNAMNAAVIQGAIIVIAAGNDYDAATGDGLQPTAFSSYATEAGARGQVIIAGASDRFGVIADFSNRAGAAAQNVYLMAPGEFIQTTGINGEQVAVSGTSFAAPHIAGAAALMLEAFPNLTAREVVDILLASAKDKGAAGVDAIHGRGLLDVGAAFQPRGALSLALPGSGSAPSPVSDSVLTLGAAFGDALAGNAALSRSVALDDYRRAYTVDLRSSVLSAGPSIGYTWRIAGDSGLVATGRSLGRSASLRALVDLCEEDAAVWRLNAPTLGRSSEELSRIENRVNLGAFGRLTLVNGAFGGDVAGLGDGAGSRFLTPMREGSPYLGLIPRGSALTDEIALGPGWSLSATAVVGKRDGGGLTGDVPANAASVTLGHGGAGYSLAASLGHVGEKGGALGGSSSGAFTYGSVARTRFAGLNGAIGLTPAWSLRASATAGWTDLANPSGLLRSFEELMSTSFRVAAAGADIFSEGDGLTLGVGQPLRVEKGTARFAAPVGFDYATETLLFGEKRVDLNPSGREIDLEAAYFVPLAPGLTARANLLYRQDSGHRDGLGETAIVLRLGARW